MPTTKPGRAIRPAPTPKPDPRLMTLQGVQGETTEAQVVSRMVVEGAPLAAETVMNFSASRFPDLTLNELMRSLKAGGEAVNRGDLSRQEQMLAEQAVVLNTMFAELARRAAVNMGTHLDATETYLKLALRAQAQSRATVETLAAMKNPPVVFAKQANIAAGHQQVNNGVAAPAGNAITPNELLEGVEHGPPPMDCRATSGASRGDTALETVGAIHRPEKRRGKGGRVP